MVVIAKTHYCLRYFQDFTINTYLTQVWTDPRLRYKDSLKLPPTSHYVDEFWLPDLIFIHAKHGHLHDVTVENKVIEISPNGTVFLIQRYESTAHLVFQPLRTFTWCLVVDGLEKAVNTGMKI